MTAKLMDGLELVPILTKIVETEIIIRTVVSKNSFLICNFVAQYVSV